MNVLHIIINNVEERHPQEPGIKQKNTKIDYTADLGSSSEEQKYIESDLHS